jgi:hypothetical protein
MAIVLFKAMNDAQVSTVIKKNLCFSEHFCTIKETN